MSQPLQCAQLTRRFEGILLGTAIGDALGLPAENLSPARIRKWWRGDWRMRFFFGRGMTSDDTEHTLMVAQTLLRHPDDPSAFQRSFAWQLRWWLMCLPAGVGMATAKACLRLWCGFSANRAGVRSAGAGPAMRSAIIGGYFFDEPAKRREFVLASSRLTHRSWQAETAALAVAECVALTVQRQTQPNPDEVLNILSELSTELHWREILNAIRGALHTSKSPQDLANDFSLQKGITGYSLHVVPIAIFSWLRYPNDYREAMTQTLNCGGDTDTVGAVLGALAGATVGLDGIPSEWRAKLWDWPRSQIFIHSIATRLAQQKITNLPQCPVSYFWPGLIPRNIFFLAIVLAHGLRRLAPY